VDGADGSSPLAIDLGCGNGRHTQLLAERGVEVVGADVSRQLLCAGIRRASERGFDATWVCADAATLPFTADTFDIGVYVATLHHLRPRSTRVESLDELERVLSPGGRALVSAWSTDHDRFDADAGFDTTIDWTLPGGVRVPRYYHIYDPGEFRTDLDRSSLSTRSVSVSSGNCYAIVEPSG
ncbi:MAG: class I SAM-dependent methyltransferase, partial [Halobacteriota archaeon]